MSAAWATVRRHGNLISFLIGIVIVFWLLYVFAPAVYPFIIGMLVAYIFLPVIAWIEKKLPKRHQKWTSFIRVASIIMIYIVILALTALISFLVITTILNSSWELIDNTPKYISDALSFSQSWFESIKQHIPPNIQLQINETVNQIGATIANSFKDALIKGASFIPTTFGVVISFIILPIFLFFILKDWVKIGRGFYSFFPKKTARYAKAIIAIIRRTFVRYILSRLLLGLILAFCYWIGLTLMGNHFATPLAAFAGIVELVPVLGIWMGGIVIILVSLALIPQNILLVVGLFFVAFILEMILQTKLKGAFLDMHPAVAMVLFSVGTYIAGFLGFLLICPVAATIVEIYRYVRDVTQSDDRGHPLQL
jgi:predicted PurR-regulated permease PerM